MFWEEVFCKSISSDEESFYKSVFIWLERPNVCNKIISCCTLENVYFPEADNQRPAEGSHAVPSDTWEFTRSIFDLKSTCSTCKVALTKSSCNDQQICYFLRKLVPRRHEHYHNSYELIVASKTYFIFIPLWSTSFLPYKDKDIYCISYNACNSCSVLQTTKNCQATISAHVLKFIQNLQGHGSQEEITEQTCTKETFSPRECFATRRWIAEKLLPKIHKWCQEENDKIDDNSASEFPSSLSLLDKEKYSLLYDTLKKKYGLEITKIWPEVTDPQKYVYEDVAIATYLLILWEKERRDRDTERKQSFIDLGCGNGLLVHILTSEGHCGKGVDIRRRKVWSIYGSATDLEEETVTPDDLSTIKGYDWLLGNHSDELTPWIPVMATRCSYNTRYWVLPCCFFDFYGKYERTQSSFGQYKDYLNFVKMVGEKCGFNVQEDVMRIPSTKRVCMIGMTKTHELSGHSSFVKSVGDFIDERYKSKPGVGKHATFEARPKLEKVKNCTKIDRKIQDEIVSTIATQLLSQTNHTTTTTGKSWNRGGMLPLVVAMKLFSDSTRLHLKSECGGLQTLLRNNNQIFEVRQGSVQLRNWCLLDEFKSKRKKRKQQNALSDFRKTKPCWFYLNHPDGCPQSDEACSFAHES